MESRDSSMVKLVKTCFFFFLKKKDINKIDGREEYKDVFYVSGQNLVPMGSTVFIIHCNGESTGRLVWGRKTYKFSV